MLVTEQQRLAQEVDALARRHGGDRSALLPILQELHRRYARVTDYAMQAVADRLNLHPVEVYGVVSFYSFFNEHPKGKFVIRMCQTISCDLGGKDAVATQLRNELGVEFGETTEDGMFTLEYTSCIGMCDQSPALVVNDTVYTRVTPARVHEIVAACRAAFGPHAMANREAAFK